MTPTESSMCKEDVRVHVRARRRGLDPAQRDALDQRIRKHLAAGVRERSVTSIAAFLAIDGEPDLEPALNTLVAERIELALPVLIGAEKRTLELHRWHRNSVMQPNDFGIREPRDGAPCRLPSVEIVFMPLVAYDRTGTRLGMGGGFYDRMLGQSGNARRPLRVGVAYALQEEPSLPRDSWDIPLDAIVNENGWFSFPL
jgi:5-formyltetrahydrofolate cyclo-ligase